MKHQITKSIRTKLLVAVSIAYLISTVMLLCLGIVIARQIIASENEKAYTNQLVVILRTLQKKQDKLVASGMEGLFADGYKLRIPPCHFQYGGRHQSIMQNHIGIAQYARSL